MFGVVSLGYYLNCRGPKPGGGSGSLISECSLSNGGTNLPLEFRAATCAELRKENGGKRVSQNSMDRIQWS